MRRALTNVATQIFDRDEELAKRKTRYAFEDPAIRAALLSRRMGSRSALPRRWLERRVERRRTSSRR
jgi:hypothetical protein